VAEPTEAPGGVTAEVLRRRWDEVLGSIQNPRAMAFLREHSQVLALEGDLLRLGFASNVVAAARQGNPETISDAVYGTLGIVVRVEVIDADADASTAARPRDAAPARPQDDPADQEEPARGRPAGVPGQEPGERITGPGELDRPALRGDAIAGRELTPVADVGPPALQAGAHPQQPAAREHVAQFSTAPATLSVTVTVPEPVPVSGPTAGGAPGDHGPRQIQSPTSAVDDAGALANADALDDADAADAAWLAGVPLEPSFPDDEPEPPVDDPEPPVDDPEPPVDDPEPPVDDPGPADGVTRGAGPLPGHRAPSSSRYGAPSSSAVPDPYDDSSADDPDIVTSGLVGVPLVIKTLNGTIIDEQVDQG